MINGKRVIGIIPARGGSKGIVDKNIANCAGKPLVRWTLEAAAHSRYLDVTIVSTDSGRIASMLSDVHVMMRPHALGRDDTPMEAVVAHVLAEQTHVDIGVLLQPTSPLRKTDDIDIVLETLVSKNATSVVTAYESLAVPFSDTDAPRRQDRKPTLMLNGAVYAFDVEWFMKHRRFIDGSTIPYIMPQERSVDVDYSYHLAIAGALIGMK